MTPSAGISTIGMPAWQAALYTGLGLVHPPPAEVFVPKFRHVVGDGIRPDDKWSYNDIYFADMPTAQWIANKYGDSIVYPISLLGMGGPYTISDNMYCTKLPDGRMVNTGILAAYYDRNPEDKYPGAADHFIRTALSL